jgi:hypothetical protein
VIIGGTALLVGYWIVTKLLGAPGWLRAAGIVLGAPVGVAIFTQRQAGRDK